MGMGVSMYETKEPNRSELGDVKLRFEEMCLKIILGRGYK